MIRFACTSILYIGLYDYTVVSLVVLTMLRAVVWESSKSTRRMPLLFDQRSERSKLRRRGLGGGLVARLGFTNDYISNWFTECL